MVKQQYENKVCIQGKKENVQNLFKHFPYKVFSCFDFNQKTFTQTLILRNKCQSIRIHKKTKSKMYFSARFPFKHTNRLINEIKTN